jgi:hypothetical protein
VRVFECWGGICKKRESSRELVKFPLIIFLLVAVFFASNQVRLHQLVSEYQLLSMAPIISGKGNRYASLHDVYGCEELVREEQEAMIITHGGAI